MSHYERRLEHDLGVIRERIAALSESIGVAIEESVNALLRRDAALAARVALNDLPINRATREVDRLCHSFVARHLPSAGHLRYISSVLRMMVAVERVGDYAVTIAREAVQLSDDAPSSVARDIELMADQARRLFKQSMKAFDEGNAELARGAKTLAGQSTNMFRKVFADLLAEGEQGSRPIKDLFALLIVVNRLERIGDQAKNVCEETIFAATGETKHPKVYRVLFVDETNGPRSVMAEAVARKAFPNSGEYESAGWNPGGALDERVLEFMGRHGHDLAEVEATKLPPRVDELDEYHVIVGLQGDVLEHMAEIPFHTAVVNWSVGHGPDDAGWELADESLEALYKDLAHRVRELMETLRGEDAD